MAACFRTLVSQSRGHFKLSCSIGALTRLRLLSSRPRYVCVNELGNLKGVWLKSACGSTQ